MKSLRYFVTGATGFIGGRVTRQLLTEGQQVHALVRDLSRAAELSGLGVVLHRGDVTDKEGMRDGMKGSDGVYNIC